MNAKPQEIADKYAGVKPGAEPTLIAHIYSEGNMWGVMIGKNGHDGYCGYGSTIADALRELAHELDVATSAEGIPRNDF